MFRLMQEVQCAGVGVSRVWHKSDCFGSCVFGWFYGCQDFHPWGSSSLSPRVFVRFNVCGAQHHAWQKLRAQMSVSHGCCLLFNAILVQVQGLLFTIYMVHTLHRMGACDLLSTTKPRWGKWGEEVHLLCQRESGRERETDKGVKF